MRNEYTIDGDLVRIAIGGRGKSKTASAIIHLTDLPKVEKYRRWVRTGGRCGKEYVIGYSGEKPKQLHKVVANTPDGWFCNFKDGDGFNCRRENLVNKSVSRPLVRAGEKLIDKYITTEPIHNVKGRYRYIVMVTTGETKKYIGTYYTKKEAVNARDAFFREMAIPK